MPQPRQNSSSTGLAVKHVGQMRSARDGWAAGDLLLAPCGSCPSAPGKAINPKLDSSWLRTGMYPLSFLPLIMYLAWRSALAVSLKSMIWNLRPRRVTPLWVMDCAVWAGRTLIQQAHTSLGWFTRSRNAYHSELTGIKTRL